MKKRKLTQSPYALGRHFIDHLYRSHIKSTESYEERDCFGQTGGAPLLDLQPAQCRWPYADGFCGCETESVLHPYCPEHMAMAYPARKPPKKPLSGLTHHSGLTGA